MSCFCKNDANIVAVIFDLDGTLLDTGILIISFRCLYEILFFGFF